MKARTKIKVAWGWLILNGITAAFLLVVWFCFPTGETFTKLAQAVFSCIVLSSPAVRYIRNHQADRDAIRDLRYADKQMDSIERNRHGI